MPKKERMKKIDWEGFFSKLNEQERDAIIVITLNRLTDRLNEHEKQERER